MLLSLRRNLISVSRLAISRLYKFNGSDLILYMYASPVTGNGNLVDDLYKLN